MENLKRFTLAGLFLLGWWVVPTQAAGPDAALTVAQRYLDAIQSGDVGGLDQLVGGALRNRLQGIWTNPEYAIQLAADNGTRTLAIKDSRMSDAGMVEVDYVLTDGEETITKRLYIQQRIRSAAGYEVIEEEILP